MPEESFHNQKIIKGGKKMLQDLLQKESSKMIQNDDYESQKN